MFYELARSSWGDEELRAAHRVLASGNLTMGEQVAQFEAEFARKFGVSHAIMVNSGSSANLLGVAALFYVKDRPLQRGDEVIVPAIAWATTYAPLQQYGLRLRFVDVDRDTLNMDPERLEAALTPRTRMVVAVNVLGNPCALDRLRAFCDAHDLRLFEDNCESMGATLSGRHCGSFGDVGTFSCFYSHQLSTIEGGVLVTGNPEIWQLARALRSHGWTRDLPGDSTLVERRDDEFPDAYRFIVPGYNLRPQELSGAVGLQQLRKLDESVRIRRRNAAVFAELFRDDARFITQRENGESSWFAFTLILNPELGIGRGAILDSLKQAGIEYRMITGGNFLRHHVIRYYDYDCAGETKNADLAHDQGFFVGNSPFDLRPQLERLYAVLDATARRGPEQGPWKQ